MKKRWTDKKTLRLYSLQLPLMNEAAGVGGEGGTDQRCRCPLIAKYIKLRN